ncbi:DUF6402 family protein [Massilia horti]|uniref:Uncharacterized protein n=1 Tax=Massilia horti TaxID=2562153 RepID=A0A4Y9T5A1_9BURK|nr:DUF6402 family protein [Massilia horti]TFW32185.1 hypothetical protein E4O92_10650 [Massilia horti]
MTLTTSVTSPKSQTAGKEHWLDVLHLDAIPGAMDNMGWKVAAKMMRQWFSTEPAYVMPEKVRNSEIATPVTRYDDQIIKMKSWALNFPRCVEPLEHLVMNWDTPAGLKLLKKRLKDKGWTPGSNITLGTTRMKAYELNMTSQVNRVEFGSLLDTFDDMYGALGKATVKIAVVGESKGNPAGIDIFEIEKLGVYIRDTYDFNDDGIVSEPLGIWSKERCLSKEEIAAWWLMELRDRFKMFPGFVPVFNSDFRRWQQAHNSGGDFVVLSDVMWIDPPVNPVKIPR